LPPAPPPPPPAPPSLHDALPIFGLRHRLQLGSELRPHRQGGVVPHRGRFRWTELPGITTGASRHHPAGPTGGLVGARRRTQVPRSEEHTSELQSRFDLVCRLLLE